MTLNLPPKVRVAIYAFFGVGSIVMTYLKAINVVGENEMSLWIALSSFGSGLAALNVDVQEKK